MCFQLIRYHGFGLGLYTAIVRVQSQQGVTCESGVGGGGVHGP